MPDKRIFFIITICLLILQGFSQTYRIEGNLFDSLAGQPTSNAVISVLKQRDTTLIKFTRSNHLGNFKLEGFPKDNYILLVTFPKYADYVELFSFGSGSVYNFNKINLSKKSTLLREIIIKHSAIRIKGDTTEYKADSFRVKPNATVEDLLKELPGIQVDKNGKITARGKTVQKVLVDGEEFFSDDPTIALRNLRADGIDKVQIFDKKNDQSLITGIDDGQTTRTINLELKDNAKKGYFGKLAVAALDEYYNSQAFVNLFKEKRKIAAFVVASSTDKTGLNFTESSRYGFGSDNFKIDEASGTIFITSEGGDNLGSESYQGEGLPESIKAGVHYSEKMKEDRIDINTNYLFNQLIESQAVNSFRQNILKDSLYYNREKISQRSTNLRHTFSGIFNLQIDSSSSLQLTTKGFTGTVEKVFRGESEALTNENKSISKNLRNYSSKGDNLSIDANLLYRKSFKKKGRTFSLDISSKSDQSNSKAYLQNESELYLNTLLPDTLDQYKTYNGGLNLFSSRLTYTESLSAKSRIEINYSISRTESNIAKFAFNKDFYSKYSVPVNSLSNEFAYRINTNSPGINYQYTDKKYHVSIGGNVAYTHFKQTDKVADSLYKYIYTNFLPQAVFNYKLNAYSNLNIKYTGITNQPNIHQLQPIKNNDDPLNIIVGNPALKQEFENTLQLGYTNYQVINEQYLFLSSFLVHITNMIGSSYEIDSFGRRIYKSVNVDDGFALSFGGGYSIKVPNTAIRLAFGPSINYTKYSNLINSLKNSSQTINVQVRLNAKIDKPNKYNLFATFIPSYNKSASTINTASKTKFTNYNFNTGGSFTLPAKFEAGTDIDINVREKINQYDINNNVLLLNVYLERKFLKNEALTLRVSINDILNQNKGYDRYITPFYTEEKTYVTYKRYGLIGLTYNFVNKGGNRVKEKDGTIRL